MYDLIGDGNCNLTGDRKVINRKKLARRPDREKVHLRKQSGFASLPFQRSQIRFRCPRNYSRKYIVLGRGKVKVRFLLGGTGYWGPLCAKKFSS